MSQSADASSQAISNGDLGAALEGALSEYFGARVSIVEMDRRPSEYRSSFAIEELDAQLDTGSTLHLIFKDLSRNALHESARRTKPDFLYDPMREIEAYRTILSPNHLSAPVCYGAIADHQLHRYWLFLENVAGVELYQVGEFAAWKQVARWLAAMHARFAGKMDAQSAHLLRYNEEFYWLWIRRARQFFGDDDAIAWLAKRYNRVVEHLLTLPVTFIHGEFYASNVVVQETAQGPRVCPVDWEMAAIGPGLFDIAALTSGRWTEEERTSLAMEYYDALAHDKSKWTTEAFLTAFEFCRLQIAVQWLGWFGRRRAFSEHAQNWLGEALRLSGRLGL